MSEHAEFRNGSADGVSTPRSGKDIIHRDQVHGDVQYDRLSVALLNTKVMQRLGRVYQLGYSHLVFRGGTHTRLSHVMGAAHVAGKIVDALRVNYKQKRAARPLHVAEPIDFLPCKERKSTGERKNLDDRWEVLRHLATWAALLHDLGHVPLGHTLEDEFEGIFKKHDDFSSPRSSYLWDTNSEVYSVLSNANLYPESFNTCEIGSTQVWQAVMLICFFKDSPQEPNFGKYLDGHSDSLQAKIEKENDTLKKQELKHELTFVGLLQEAWAQTKDLFGPYMTDIVANTICADYLDYVRRDPLNVGLDVLRDDRILSHFYVSTDSTGLRMALALLDRHGKPRLDVCTGVVEQVRQRYRFAESIYYHKTKVSASAMFAKAMILIGQPQEVGKKQELLFEDCSKLEGLARNLSANPSNFSKFKESCLPSALLDPEIGDDSLHLFLLQRGVDNIEKLMSRKNGGNLTVDQPTSTRAEEIHAQLRGIALLQAVTRRQLYKVAFSINAAQFGRLTVGASQDSAVEARLKIALESLRTDKTLRDRVEKRLADAADWPIDSILLYVPPRKTQAKGIETFAFDKKGVVRLNEHRAVSEKVGELGRDYKDLWRILIVVHPMYHDKVIDLSQVADALATELWSNFSKTELEVNLHEEEQISLIREISWFTYIRKDHRIAAQDFKGLAQNLSNPIYPDWELFERSPIFTSRFEATLASDYYAERALLLQLLIQKEDGLSEKNAIRKIRETFRSSDPIGPKHLKSSDLSHLAKSKDAFNENAYQRKAFLVLKVSEEISPTKKEKATAKTQERSVPIVRRSTGTRQNNQSKRPRIKKQTRRA